MPLYIAQSGDLDRCYRCLTHSQWKDRATQLLIKYKSGALVTQYILKHQKALQLALMVFSLFNPYCMFTFVAPSA